MIVKLLTEHHLEFLSLRGSSESTLVKMPHCWKFHVTAQDYLDVLQSKQRPSQGFWGIGKKGYLFQWNKGQILRGPGKQRQYWKTGNIRNQIFDFWGAGEQVNLFQGNKGTGTPPPHLGGPQNIQFDNFLFEQITKLL